jgi:anaerobic dimethyl sulfoxide reductase subunit B (iron-sulfur subunit)
MTKDEETGIVSNDLEVCIGCGKCAEACPYDASQVYEVQKKARKCDMCRDLLDQGEEAACVGICPQRVLEIGDYTELKAKYGDLINVQPLPDPSQTNPCVVINPHRDAIYEPGKGRLLSLEQ